MAEEIAFENGRISNFKGLVTLTLTLNQIALHTVVHHLSTSTYTPNVVEIEEMFCGQTNVISERVCGLWVVVSPFLGKPMRCTVIHSQFYTKCAVLKTCEVLKLTCICAFQKQRISVMS